MDLTFRRIYISNCGCVMHSAFLNRQQNVISNARPAAPSDFMATLLTAIYNPHVIRESNKINGISAL